MVAASCLVTMDFRVCTDGNAGCIGVVVNSTVEICDIFNNIQQCLKNRALIITNKNITIISVILDDCAGWSARDRLFITKIVFL